MAGSSAAGAVSKKREAPPTLKSIAESGGHKYSSSYTNFLYRIGITTTSGISITPPVVEDTHEVRKHFPEPKDLPSLSRVMKNRFEKFQPNESHNLDELLKGDEGIKYPIIKRDPIETPAEEDLRSRSDFVFAASTDYLGDKIRAISRSDGTVRCVSNNNRTCAVAIVGEVKATSSPTSVAAAKNQWSSLAYLQIMELVSIRREAYYVGDETICHYLKDIENIINAHPESPELLERTWQEATENLSRDSGGKPEIEMLDASALEEQQPPRPPFGAENEGETQSASG